MEFRNKYGFGGGYWTLLIFIICSLKCIRLAPVEKVFHKQLRSSGSEALPVIAVIAVLCGALVVTQTTSLVGGNSELTVKMLIWLVVREMGPVLSAMVIIARSSAAVASELALMKVNREFEYLERMGISPLEYLIVPRAAAITLAVLALSVYFQIVVVGGGLAVSSLFQNTSMLEQTGRFLQVISVMDIVMVVVKGWLFGAVIAVISCYHGFFAESKTSGIPKAAIQAVIKSLLAVYLIDVVLAYVFSKI